MDPDVMRLNETMAVGKRFEQADKEYGKMLDLLGDDEIKWEMCAYLIPRMEALLSRHEGAELMAKGEHHNRNFMIEELKAMTEEKLSIAAEVRRRLSGLTGN